MTQRTKCTCQLVVGIAGAVMGVAAWAIDGFRRERPQKEQVTGGE